LRAAPRCEDPVLDESATGCSRKCVQGGIVPHSCEVVGEGGGGGRVGLLMVQTFCRSQVFNRDAKKARFERWREGID